MTFGQSFGGPAGASAAGLAGSGDGSDGFEVDIDELDRVARAFTEATEVILRADSAEGMGGLGLRGTSPTTRPVPGWLHDYDHGWCALRDEVIRAQRDSVRALRETARAYLDSDLSAGEAIAAADAPRLGLGLPDSGEPAASGAVSAVFPSSAAPPGRDDRSARGHSVDGAGGVVDLDDAVELWRRRRDGATGTVEVVRAALGGLRWRGAASAAFTAWAQEHVRRCAELIDRADLATAALARADLAAPGSFEAPRPWRQLVAPTGFVPPSVDPALPGNPVAETAPTTPETNAPALTPATHPNAEHPNAEHGDGPSRDDEHLELAEFDTGAYGVAEPGTVGAVPPDEPASDHDETTTPPGRLDVLPAVAASTLPVAAAASTALFARVDRAHHVVRDIHLPPPTSDPAPYRGPSPAGGTRAPGPTASGGRTTSPGEPDELVPVGRPMPPVIDTPTEVWINLARAEDPPAWIDLAATRGLGLTGPGADAIARTLWHRLHDHHPRALLIAPHPLARHLLGHPPPDSPGAQGIGTDIPGVLVVPDPRQGLTAAWEQVEHRRSIGLHTAPVVLFAPAPATGAARSDLAQSLARSPRTAFTAVLLGHWDTGTTLTITEQHHVSDHHQPAPGRPPLTGARLEPTNTGTRNTEHETGTTERDRPSTEDSEPTVPEHSDLDAPAERAIKRTPLALSVLGPVQLRYRRPATDDEPTDAVRQRPDDTSPESAMAEEVLTVPDISRPGRELLAYLAAHPGGATRDTIIEAIWPDSGADRPDTAFHTTLSRLRKRLRDTTGTNTTSDIIIATDGRWHLNRAHVTVDYWTFLETHPRNPDPTLRRHDHHIAIHLYQGPFAADLTGEWTHTIREATRRRYLEAINDLAETEITTNPDLALDLLERARNLEPLNEAIYRNIIRIHLDAQRSDAAERTYELLRTHLDTIDAAPEPETERLVAGGHAFN